MHHMAWLTNGLSIRRPKKKMNLTNEQLIKTSYHCSTPDRRRAFSYTRRESQRTLPLCSRATTSPPTLGLPVAATGTTTPTSAATPAAAADNCCEVCLIGQRDGVTLVPCGHASFCATCVDRVVTMGTGCPICRADTQMVCVSITETVATIMNSVPSR